MESLSEAGYGTPRRQLGPDEIEASRRRLLGEILEAIKAGTDQERTYARSAIQRNCRLLVRPGQPREAGILAGIQTDATKLLLRGREVERELEALRAKIRAECAKLHTPGE